MNVLSIVPVEWCQMQEPEPDSEQAGSGPTAITGPSPARPPEAPIGQGEIS